MVGSVINVKSGDEGCGHTTPTKRASRGIAVAAAATGVCYMAGGRRRAAAGSARASHDTGGQNKDSTEVVHGGG